MGCLRNSVSSVDSSSVSTGHQSEIKSIYSISLKITWVPPRVEIELEISEIQLQISLNELAISEIEFELNC